MTQAEYTQELIELCNKMGELLLMIVNDHSELYEQYEAELNEVRERLTLITKIVIL